jgi:hypothetical protein
MSGFLSGHELRRVSTDVFLDAAEPRGSFVLVRAMGGYTTNLALDDLTGGKAASSA